MTKKRGGIFRQMMEAKPIDAEVSKKAFEYAAFNTNFRNPEGPRYFWWAPLGGMRVNKEVVEVRRDDGGYTPATEEELQMMREAWQ